MAIRPQTRGEVIFDTIGAALFACVSATAVLWGLWLLGHSFLRLLRENVWSHPSIGDALGWLGMDYRTSWKGVQAFLDWCGSAPASLLLIVGGWVVLLVTIKNLNELRDGWPG